MKILLGWLYTKQPVLLVVGVHLLPSILKFTKYSSSIIIHDWFGNGCVVLFFEDIERSDTIPF